MAYLNFTNRLELKCNSEPLAVSDFIVYASSLENKIFIFSPSIEKIKNEIKKKFKNIDLKKVEVYLEAYRDAFRKEIKLGDLDNLYLDQINFFQNKIETSKSIDRSLGEIDSSTVRCRIIFNFEMKNIGSSESMGFRPIIFTKKDEIVLIEKKRKSSLIGVLEEEMDRLYYSDFHGEAPFDGAPTIYVNKKLNVKNDLNSDKRISTIIFSTAFEDLLRKSLINPDNEYKNQLIEYAQNHNDNVQSKELIEKISEMSPDEIFQDQEINEFLSNAIEGYIQDFNFISKYIYDQQRFNNDEFDDGNILGDDYED